MCYFGALEIRKSPFFPLSKRGTERDFLDPTFPLHLFKEKIYFEGTGNKTQELWINNEKKRTFVVKA
ncbi:MAG: hypothetical protein ABIL14_07540, partial [candidate division WOR-3 bacterium]